MEALNNVALASAGRETTKTMMQEATGTDRTRQVETDNILK